MAGGSWLGRSGGSRGTGGSGGLGRLGRAGSGGRGPGPGPAGGGGPSPAGGGGPGLTVFSAMALLLNCNSMCVVHHPVQQVSPQLSVELTLGVTRLRPCSMSECVPFAASTVDCKSYSTHISWEFSLWPSCWCQTGCANPSALHRSAQLPIVRITCWMF